MQRSLLLSLLTLVLPAAAWAEFRLATFSADITVPIGHGMMGGSWEATQVVDPLLTGTIQLDSRLVCLVFGRCASLLGTYVFGLNMRAPRGLHIDKIRCAAEDTTN